MRQNVAFHVRENDYFGTLATVLDLMRQDLHEIGVKHHAGTLARVCEELLELQRTCRIELLGQETEENSAVAA